MIDIDGLLKNNLKNLEDTNNPIFKAASSFLKKILRQDEINNFIRTNKHLEGLEFNDAVLEHFNFTFRVSNKERLRIPDQGRVLIVANHPIGSLDGLALLKLISEIRSDVKIVATNILSHIDPLKHLFHSVDNLSKKANHRQSMKDIVQSLESEHAVIMFPTGEVSRIRPNGIRDGKWKTGFLHLSRKTGAPILPVHIDGKNSGLFYSLSSIYKPLGTVMLVNEMFNKIDTEISFRIGKPISWKSIAALDMPKREIAKRMRKQVYLIGKKKKTELFQPIENIIHPAKTKLLRKELRASQLLGKTQDKKHIYLYDYHSNSSVMREIGRLRELSFRQADEGTGNALDIDDYDRYYRHLILWDDDELEIIGSYRIGETATILANKGKDGLYTHSLFRFNDRLLPYLENSIELGRSFIQPRYQGKRGLDYLWYGIGAYLQQHPDIKYLFGAVSLSDSYPQEIQASMASFYTGLFGNQNQLAEPRLPFQFTNDEDFIPFTRTRDEDIYKKAFSLLKHKLAGFGVRVPTLFKQYVELCELGGCEFLAFNIDKNFSNCVDALILLHRHAIKEKKRQRYIDTHTQDTHKQDAA